MIVVFFECDTCGVEFQFELEDYGGLKFLPIPKGWVWVNEKAFCKDCRRYSGVTIGEN